MTGLIEFRRLTHLGPFETTSAPPNTTITFVHVISFTADCGWEDFYWPMCHQCFSDGRRQVAHFGHLKTQWLLYHLQTTTPGVQLTWWPIVLANMLHGHLTTVWPRFIIHTAESYIFTPCFTLPNLPHWHLVVCVCVCVSVDVCKLYLLYWYLCMMSHRKFRDGL